MSKKSGFGTLLIVIIILLTATLGLFLTFSGILSTKTEMVSDFFTESEDGAPPIFQQHMLNVTVYDEDETPLKNVWVVVFDNGVAKLYGYTNEQGMISFELIPGEYLIQFEKYHYDVASASIIVSNENQNIAQTMMFEETMAFGVIPSWLIMFAIGLMLFGLIYWNRKSLNLRRFSKPYNWFGSSRSGSWTFLDKSTKSFLYGISAILLVLLIIVVIPNFPTFKDMAIYYVVLGAIAVGGLLLEGGNKKTWIAAIGFGKQDEILGNIALGISFSLLFIGLTGFLSQLCIFSVTSSSIISILMFVIVASYFEEGFFSGILAPTIAEKNGIIPGIILTSILFMLAHGFAYGWVMFPMVSAFAFRFVATTIVLHRKSWLGVFIAHVIINALSLFSFMMFS